MAAPYPIDYSHKSGFAMPNVGHEADTFTRALFKIGTSAAPVHIKTTTIPLFEIQATTALTVATQVPFSVTMTTATTGAYIRAGLFTLDVTNVRLGEWSNALKAIVKLNTTGAVSGLVSVICAEMTLATAGVGAGTYACMELQMVCPNTCIMSAGTSIFRIDISGLSKAVFDGNDAAGGYLFDIAGLAEGDTKFFDSGGSPTADGGIRCRFNGAVRYILYADDAS